MAATHAVIPKKCSLYKQPRSDKWWCRIKLDNGKWHRAGTGEEDLDRAKEKALTLYYETQVKSQHNLAQVSRSFLSVAKSVVEKLDSLRDTKDWKQSYQSYLYVIKRYQIPYFGNTALNNLRDKYDGYVEYVSDELGRTPKASTLSNHNAALKLILDTAIQHGWITQIEAPRLRSNNHKSTRRPTFDMKEYRTLIQKLRHWKDEKTHRARDQEIRLLLHDYVLILANSGIRHGRVAMDIKWKNIKFDTSKNGNEIVLISVLMKKGRYGTERRRDVVLRHNTISDARVILTRLKDRRNWTDLTIEQVIKRHGNERLFALSDGSQPKRMDGTFGKFLKDCDLEYGTDEQKRTLYSLRHFYATTELLRKNPISIHLLAVQMGTSVKMIELHYSHLKSLNKADQLSGWEQEEHDTEKARNSRRNTKATGSASKRARI